MDQPKDSVTMSDAGKIADLLAKFDELSPEEQEYALEAVFANTLSCRSLVGGL